MTRAQHQANMSGTWPALFNEQRATLNSRRDTALLLGMSNANIDQLHKFAERRIRYFSNGSPQPPDVSGSSQTIDRIEAWR